MARRTETMERDEVVVTSEALGYEASEDLLPEVMSVVGGVLERLDMSAVSMGDDVMKLAPMLGGIAAQLGGGRLKALAPRILAGTSVVMPLVPGGEKLKYDLVKKEDRAAVFEAHPELYFPILFFAGKVTFGRFFPVSGRPKKDSQTATSS